MNVVCVGVSLGTVKHAVRQERGLAGVCLPTCRNICASFHSFERIIRTGMFNPEEAKYANGALVELPYPTNDVRLMKKAATEAVNRLFQRGFKHSKAEVLLLDLRQPGEFTDDLFAALQPVAAEKVMDVLDQINTRMGRGTLRSGSVPAEPEWAMREMMSQSYTTRFDQLCTVKWD